MVDIILCISLSSLSKKMATASAAATIMENQTQSYKMKSIKAVAESPGLNTIPSNYAYSDTSNESLLDSDRQEDSIPIIDFSMLTSSSPDQRSRAIHDLGKACQDWGFFMVVNHDIPEDLMKKVMNGIEEFFNLTEEEKLEFEGKDVLDPIRCGTSFNATKDKVFFWRDFLKVFVHPHFHFPNKPRGFSDVSLEYCEKTRKLARALLRGISESLGLEKSSIEKAFDLEEDGLQIFISNLYPPCPQPELAMGIPPHSDHGLLTLLTENQGGGLQLQHKGKWVNVNALPNSFLVNTADHLEIFSNGKYKSVLHRAIVNNKTTRISLAMAHGPSLDAIVSPAPELVEFEKPAYKPMKYKEYLGLQQGNHLDGKSCLDRVRV